MAALVSFLAGANFTIQDLSGSGLGFYGDAGFGASVQVGAYQGHTFITNGAGTSQGPEVGNVKFLNAGSGIIGQTGSGVALTAIPNYQASLNIRFTYDTPIKVQNAKVQIYDRTTPTNAASGVTTKVAQIIHPGITQSNTGSGDTQWTTFTGSATGQFMNLCPCPGTSGFFAGNGSNSLYTDSQHDWYVALSASPDSIGSKTLYGLYVYLEYL